jgi:hypothetical protein
MVICKDISLSIGKSKSQLNGKISISIKKEKAMSIVSELVGNRR